MSRLSINHLWNAPVETAWQDALATYWNFVKPSLKSIEVEMDSLLASEVERMDQQEWYDFLKEKYFRWKYTAPNRYATTTRSLQTYLDTRSLGSLHSIKVELFSFDKENARLGIEIASRIKGLGTAGASGLLSILLPRQFGTVDQFVVKALREVQGLPEVDALKKMTPENLKSRDGAILIAIMRRQADVLNESFRTNVWTPRKIDMVLWTYGR